ncbi:hypothetical protein [Arsukibacterium sp.]|uniref:hypothetical protein n=1 Tax=Arsukibacterium sp. TaxID=1977258 RepID=UPI00299EB0C5|nr:hypothetical protein [Arsukibacterium sp.]MDX1538826.1 hypothetical protein [Arsukibacterium sp.]
MSTNSKKSVLAMALAHVDLKTEIVVVPEWNDAEITLSEMSGAVRGAYEAYMATAGFYDKETGQAIESKFRQLFRPAVIAFSLADTEGNLREDLVNQLASKSPKALDRLFKVADKLNLLSAGAHEDAAKN